MDNEGIVSAGLMGVPSQHQQVSCQRAGNKTQMLNGRGHPVVTAKLARRMKQRSSQALANRRPTRHERKGELA